MAWNRPKLATSSVIAWCLLTCGAALYVGCGDSSTEEPAADAGVDSGSETPDGGDVDGGDPADSGTGSAQLQVAGGGEHTCAIIEGGAVKCWGRNQDGQLGLGDTQNRGDELNEMGAVLPVVNLGTPAIALTAGEEHTCALLQGGAVKCWGSGSSGRLGLGDSNSRGLAPEEMASLPNVDLGASATAIAAGGLHTCALLQDGSVKCWGNNGSGQLGIGDNSNRENPVAVPLGGTATAIAAGYRHTCAVLTGGTLKCWGENGSGQLGLDDLDPRGDDASDPAISAMAPIAVGANVTAVAAGGNHTCAVLTGGALKCWGNNTFGQLGVGDAEERGGAAGDMAALPAVDLAPVSHIAAGMQHTCARLQDGTVKCWGQNHLYGQLGIGENDHRGDGPDEMGDRLPAVAVGVVDGLAVGGYHVCTSSSEGVKCWGKNENGQLGKGDIENVRNVGSSHPFVSLQ